MYLRYFGIRVTDLGRSSKFYTELLGLKEAGRGSMSQYGADEGTGSFWKTRPRASGWS